LDHGEGDLAFSVDQRRRVRNIAFDLGDGERAKNGAERVGTRFDRSVRRGEGQQQRQTDRLQIHFRDT